MADSIQTSVSDPPSKKKPFQFDASKIKDVTWRGQMQITYDGADPDVHFGKVRNMELRDDDVILCTYPKSGTHWTWRILDMLLHKTSGYSNDRFIDHGMLDLQPPERVQNMDSSRVLTTHLPFTSLPVQVKEKRTKIVHVYRNPKAVLVSMYFQQKTPIRMPDITMDELEEKFSSGKGFHGNWFSWIEKVEEFEQENPEVPVTHVSYEELKQESVKTIQKLANILEVEVSKELCGQIAEAVSFKRQQEEECKRADPRSHSQRFYRKGETDDWKNYLTVAQSERLDDVIRRKADRCRFAAKYVTPCD